MLTHVVYEVVDRVAIITINRPHERNSLNFVVTDELKKCFLKADADKNIRVIIFRSIGPDFSGGLDLKYLRELQSHSLEANVFDSQNISELLMTIQMVRKPVVGQIRGLALSSGCALALACDVCISQKDTVFGFREVKLGLVPAIVSSLLVQKLGMSRAKYLLITGELISSDEAWALGIVHRVVPNQQLENEVIKLAVAMAEQNAPEAMEFTKRLLNDLPGLPLDDQKNLSVRMSAHSRLNAEAIFAVNNILERTPFKW